WSTSALMPARPVLRLPDHQLKEPSVPVGRIDDRARALAVDLVDTMRASPACVGLAAPQIGVGLRAFVIDVTGHKKARSCHDHLDGLLFLDRVLSHDSVFRRKVYR